MSDLHLGVIGNCSYGALVDRAGRVVWCCLPRFDSEPVFATLLDHEDGLFRVVDFAPARTRILLSPGGGRKNLHRLLRVQTKSARNPFKAKVISLRAAPGRRC